MRGGERARVKMGNADESGRSGGREAVSERRDREGVGYVMSVGRSTHPTLR